MAVVDYNNISSGHIDAEAASASSEQEDELLTLRLFILVNHTYTIIVGGPAINTAIS
jgi:hypothetical protein